MFKNILHQSPTGHLNQIYKDNERQVLHIVSQFLQIIHKIYRNLSRRGHKNQKAPIEDNWRLFFTLNHVTKNLRLCDGAHPLQFLKENLKPACIDINVVMSSRV